MTLLISWCLGIIAIFFAVPATVFFFEVLAASSFSKRRILLRDDRPRGRVAVLIPAHNEGLGLQPTVEDVKNQLREGDRLVVVADNCTDTTAAVAASLGAEIIVRNDPTKIGKGYALDCGVNHLATDAPDIVIIIDADCRVEAGTIDKLATVCATMRQPIQSRYLMAAPVGSSINHQVAEFAWRIKNWVRPMGLNVLDLPCQLMGSGMAFPWEIIRSAELASGHIVEDLKLGLDLARAGHAPVFYPSATVTSCFANSTKGTNTQRRRWEHGHIGLILTAAPALLMAALKRGDTRLFALALDLTVPPLSLLILILTAMLIGSGLAILFGASSLALAINLTCLALLAAATILAWFKFGRDVLPLKSLALIPSYVAAKLPHYGTAFLGRRVPGWIRSDRG
jgi:cellulose synthase/poly-beta-1,6-N-acetylglucosamine synthase-like glycosyltransferase